MPITVTNGLLYARQMCLDTDTTTPAHSDAELVRDANAVYSFIRDVLSPRYVWETATTLGTTVTSNVAPITLTTVAEIRAAFNEAGASATSGNPMRRVSFELLGRLIQSGAGGPTSVGDMYAPQRLGTFTAANVGKWNILVSNGVSFVSAMVRYEITELDAASGTGKPDLTDGETYTMWEIVAARAAARMDRMDLAANLMAQVPEALRARFDVARVTIQPREPAGAKIA